MLKSIEEFTRWFEGVNRRAIRDVSTLPDEAFDYRPEIGEGEGAWTIAQIVQHMAESRIYFASAFGGRGWVWDVWPTRVTDRDSATLALAQSANQLAQSLLEVDDGSLIERVELIGDQSQSISRWRVLMMMAEHDIHHRSQIDTYAGINGWPLAHIFDRTAEWVASQKDQQISLYRKQ